MSLRNDRRINQVTIRGRPSCSHNRKKHHRHKWCGIKNAGDQEEEEPGKEGEGGWMALSERTRKRVRKMIECGGGWNQRAINSKISSIVIICILFKLTIVVISKEEEKEDNTEVDLKKNKHRIRTSIDIHLKVEETVVINKILRQKQEKRLYF